MNLIEYIRSIQSAIPEIKSISITDRDGVDVLNISEASEESQILSVIFVLTHEQVQKLEEIGETDYILTEFEDGSSMLHMNASPLQITFHFKDVARQTILNAASLCRKAISGLRKEIVSLAH